MKTFRSMVLVSSDPASNHLGAQRLFEQLQKEIEAFGLTDEISVAQVSDLGRHDAIPMVVVYPEAVVYGPVRPVDAHLLVEEHLYKGRVVEDLLAPVRELSGPIAWVRARKGSLPPSGALCWNRPAIDRKHRRLHCQQRLRGARKSPDGLDARRSDG
jgi:NADP-reducing hydrogenase subunit HndC